VARSATRCDFFGFSNRPPELWFFEVPGNFLANSSPDFTCEPFGSQLILLTVEGPRRPLEGGLVGFVALRCYAEECAFSLSTQAQDRVWDLAEYKRVEPAHCQTGATSGGTGSERKHLWAHHLLCLRMRLVLCMTVVL
jgi:hypothetical protein